MGPILASIACWGFGVIAGMAIGRYLADRREEAAVETRKCSIRRVGTLSMLEDGTLDMDNWSWTFSPSGEVLPGCTLADLQAIVDANHRTEQIQ